MRQMVRADANRVADVLQGELFVKMGIDVVLDLSGDDVGTAAHGIPLIFAVFADDQQQLGNERRGQIVTRLGRALGIGREQAMDHAHELADRFGALARREYRRIFGRNETVGRHPLHRNVSQRQ